MVNYINAENVSFILRSPARLSLARVRELCDYDLVAVLHIDQREHVRRAALAEAKRRGLIEPTQPRRTTSHPKQTVLFYDQLLT